MTNLLELLNVLNAKKDKWEKMMRISLFVRIVGIHS